jgi:hypothetical protein
METIMSTLVQAVLTAKVVSIAPPAPQPHDAAASGKQRGSSLLVPVLPRNATQH